MTRSEHSRRRRQATEAVTSGDEDCLANPVFWMGSTKRDLSRMPQAVKTIFGYALFKAQVGEKHPDAKPMRGFGGAAKVTEVVVDDEADTYRTMYTVELGATSLCCIPSRRSRRRARARQKPSSMSLSDVSKMPPSFMKDGRRNRNHDQACI